MANCSTPGVQGQLEMTLIHNGYPIILPLSLIGNGANLIVYQHQFLRDSPTVRMLCIRSMALALFSLTVLPIYAHTMEGTEPIRPIATSDYFARFYWQNLKHVLFTSNAFSMIATWMTVTVTAEHYILVVFPISARRWSTMTNANLLIVFIAVVAIAFHSFNLFSLDTKATLCHTDANIIVYTLMTKSELGDMEKIYYVMTALLMHALPLVLLIAFSFSIYRRLAALGQMGTNERKQCVTRMAMATTACHFLFEFPLATVNTAAAIPKLNIVRHLWFQQMYGFVNFLSLTNCALPFFIYMGCSRKFRQLAGIILCPCIVKYDEGTLAALDNRVSKSKQSVCNIGRQTIVVNDTNSVRKQQSNISSIRSQSHDAGGIHNGTDLFRRTYDCGQLKPLLPLTQMHPLTSYTDGNNRSGAHRLKCVDPSLNTAAMDISRNREKERPTKCSSAATIALNADESKLDECDRLCNSHSHSMSALQYNVTNV